MAYRIISTIDPVGYHRYEVQESYLGFLFMKEWRYVVSCSTWRGLLIALNSKMSEKNPTILFHSTNMEDIVAHIELNIKKDQAIEDAKPSLSDIIAQEQRDNPRRFI